MLVSRRAAWTLLGLILAIELGYILYPSIRVFLEGLRPSNATQLFTSWNSANVRALTNSVLVSIGSVVGSGILGTTLAYTFFRYKFPLRRTLMAVAAVPLALPPLVGVLAFLFLYGETGIVPRVLQAALELDSVPFSFRGLPAILLVHVYSLYVYFYLFVMAALQSIDRGVMEASADLGASPTRTFWQVVFPQLRPALASASLLVFMISMASFTAPLLFAGTEQFLTLQIYNYKTNGNLGLSASASTLLTLICLVFLIILEFNNRRRLTGTSSKGIQPLPPSVTTGIRRYAFFSVSVLFLAFLLLPILTVVLISFAREGSWTVQILPAAYTAANYAKLVGDASFFEPIRNSLIMAVAATAACTVFGLFAGLLIEKTRMPLRWLIRGLAVLPFAIPGTVVAINFILTFARPSFLSAGQILVGTFWILPLAYFVRNVPIAVRAALASLESYDDRLTEASQDLGAGALTTLRRVVLPAITPGLVAGALLTFVAGLGEFVSSILLYIVDNKPISVEIWSQLRIYDFGAAAAYSVFLMLIVAGSTVVTRLVSRSDQARTAF